jgi:hypothetical protein
MSEPIADHAVSEKLAQLPSPAVDPSLRDRTLRRARAELRRPGEGTVSLRGLGLAWETALAPAIVLLAGAAYTIGAVLQIASIFAG